MRSFAVVAIAVVPAVLFPQFGPAKRIPEEREFLFRVSVQGPDGGPYPGALVTLRAKPGNDHTGFSDSQGTWQKLIAETELPLVYVTVEPPDPFVTRHRESFVDDADSLKVADDRVQLSVRLADAGVARLLVVDERGNPVAKHPVGINYGVRDEPPGTWQDDTRFTDDGGAVEFRGLLPGPWEAIGSEWRDKLPAERVFLEVWPRRSTEATVRVLTHDPAVIISGRFPELVGQPLDDSYRLRDLVLECSYGRRNDRSWIYDDGAFFSTCPIEEASIRVVRGDGLLISQWFQVRRGDRSDHLAIQWAEPAR